MLGRFVATALLFTCAVAGAVDAQQVPRTAMLQGQPIARCAGADALVAAKSPEVRQLACHAAEEVLRLLGHCAIGLHRSLQIEISDEVLGPLGVPTFGLFDARREVVAVTDQGNIASLVEGTPFGKLAPGEFYRSLLVHEIVHGVMHQNLRRPAATHAAHEYPAYALQIESLPAQTREAFLQGIASGKMNADFLFSDVLLFADRYFFAAMAYQHYASSSDKCRNINELLDGEAPFIWTMP